ncbi:hypothetical protein J1605_006458 [Eschrichtius robustus]|uniref:Coiled-coil domain-containing protein n=1 Tax=Eschrichtius robustus TaxID=9764 RepID=A0AB34H494_ESCRO|nr:hypothetical protein J1605_006458 [Eschrichtius robustus]
MGSATETNRVFCRHVTDSLAVQSKEWRRAGPYPTLSRRELAEPPPSQHLCLPTPTGRRIPTSQPHHEPAQSQKPRVVNLRMVGPEAQTSFQREPGGPTAARGADPWMKVPRASPAADEQLFRSVEGQAASDEEDDSGKWQEARRPPAEVKALLAGLSSCGSGCVCWCDDQTAKKLMTYFTRFGSADHARALGELEQLGTQGCSGKTLGTPGEEAELQQKVEENEHLRLELQMVETERVRLSLLEEKLEDVLQLLRRLRDLRGRLAPQPCWMPCTELWLAVSSCVDSPRHQPLQLQHSATPSSSPAEVASPVCGPPGQPGHRQTSLEEQPGHHHILRTLEVQPPSETGPSSEPGSHPFLGFLPDSLAAPAFLLPGSTLPYGCWISLYLLQSPLPLEWSCTLFCPVQSRIPSLGSQGLLPFLPTACLPQGLCVPPSPGETTHASGIVEGQAGLGELQGGQRDHCRLPGGAGLELALEEG